MIKNTRLWKELHKLSLKELYKLAELARIVFLNEPEDKEELITILGTESSIKIKNALKKLKKSIT